MTDTVNPSAQRLAGAFVALLQRDLPSASFFAMRVRNSRAGEGVCASHDFCDSNVTMDEAFTALFGRGAESTGEDCALWNAAWDIAKADHLTDAATSIASMTEEYTAWCTAEGLPLVAAEEQDPEAVTEVQWTWLQWFITRWDIVQEIEDGR